MTGVDVQQQGLSLSGRRCTRKCDATQPLSRADRAVDIEDHRVEIHIKIVAKGAIHVVLGRVSFRKDISGIDDCGRNLGRGTKADHSHFISL